MSNRLAHTQSLYLRKHADNPIDWWSWCDEALAKARQENRPIFLSIGYSSCHWCTVMEGEAFSDPNIAAYLNTHFLPIKVDREERPDLDSIYMQALQLMTGQGGWPLNIFLTPDDLVPFYGGTYFSVEPRYGRPAFVQLLQTLHRLYEQDPQKLLTVKGEVMKELQRSLQTPQPEPLDSEILRRGIESNTGIVASEGHAPCFPMIPYTELALRGIRLEYESPYDGRHACTQRGLDLALGGIYDHVAGGFHRYTVDATWTVPHFEKMLYDNGQIMEYLANLWSFGVQEPAFDRAIAGTVNWLKREMTAERGYFYAAQDADSFIDSAAAEPEEGAFYVWRYAELEALLNPAQLEELQANFTVTLEGNFEGQTVLQRRQIGLLSATLEEALTQLFAVRYGALPSQVPTFPPARNNQEARNHPWPGRIPAVTDPKMIVAWNSLMISGLARASAVLHRSEYLQLATSVADWILEHQSVNQRLHRLNYEGQVSLFAQSEDYALLIKALLDLQQASLLADRDRAPFWLTQAQALQAEFDQFFWSEAEGGYYNTASDTGQDLLIRERSYMDNATPAANGVAIANLVRLFLVTENIAYRDRAGRGLGTFSSVIKSSPRACPSLLSALDWYQNATFVQSRSEQIEALIPQYFPTVMFHIVEDLPTDVVGLVCQGVSCSEPAMTTDQLLAQLERMTRRAKN